MYYTHCLQSIKNNRLYIGYTSDLKRRFEEHNTKIGGDFTSKNGPWKLIFYEAFIDKKDAEKQERFYKKGCGREVLKNKLQNYFSNYTYSRIV